MIFMIWCGHFGNYARHFERFLFFLIFFFHFICINLWWLTFITSFSYAKWKLWKNVNKNKIIFTRHTHTLVTVSWNSSINIIHKMKDVNVHLYAQIKWGLINIIVSIKKIKSHDWIDGDGLFSRNIYFL